MRQKLLLFVAGCMLLAPISASAFTWDQQQYEFGAKVGVIFPGEVTVDGGKEVDLDTNSGLMMSLKVDATVSPKLSVGLFAHQFQNSVEESSSDITTRAIGATLKYRATLGDNFQLRPGVSLGYNFNISGAGLKEDATGMEVGAFVETAYHLSNGHIITGELGFVAQPNGGNSDINLTYGPIGYLMIGYSFGM